MAEQKKIGSQVVCPKCGYRMPIFYVGDAECKGGVVCCKGRNCSNKFEIRITEGKQIK